MSKQILVNSTPHETRIAQMEDHRVAELFFERSSDKGIVGNIYKGKVVRVLPGMQAAFVDIGHERAAFLYAGDFYKSKHHADELDADEEDHIETTEKRRRRKGYEPVPPIAELVREGQEILVQVAKGPIGTKGARLTCHLSLPGRFLVFMPTLKHNGVSRKIESYDLRRKLKKLIDQFKSKEGGFIVRTAASADHIGPKQLKHDVEYLLNMWSKIGRKYRSKPAPNLLHYDLDLTTRTIRDHLDDDVERLIVDSSQEHRRILRFIRNFNPDLKYKIELYQDKIPLFDRYQVEPEINRALGKRVWLKSGGYLIIETTEALTSIDVNTGRFVGKKTLEETILRTNMEAAEEIVKQLRLRNIGGIIIIDFIDMEKDSSKDQVYRFLDNLVREDKQRTTILKISNLGLVEMTRKRGREPLLRYITETCPTCDGKSFVKSRIALAHQCLRDIRRELAFLQDDHLYVTVHPEVYQVLSEQEANAIIELEKQFQKGVKLQKDAEFHIEQIAIHPQHAPKAKGALGLAPISTETQHHTPPTDAEEDDNDEDAYQEDLKEIEQSRQEQERQATESNDSHHDDALEQNPKEGDQEVAKNFEDDENNEDEDGQKTDDEQEKNLSQGYAYREEH